MNSTHITTSKLAKQSGVNLETIRYYERVGLLPKPPRSIKELLAMEIDMNEPSVTEKAKQYGVASVPAIAVDGTLADCCTDRGVNEASLRAAGVGVPLS